MGYDEGKMFNFSGSMQLYVLLLKSLMLKTVPLTLLKSVQDQEKPAS